ncbi:hypothetical protein [Sedimenticola hydrogenitrophicus]|uniref:hypothetical protein n=1 Tax=Sedimenticola hydrogenitrophicus TaxID=2967975 RepID=UPI0023B08F09|nr:hypothetical protein [Sedimenticola hydrogenitrophicus]
MPDYKVNRPVKLGSKIHKPGGKPITADAETAAPAVASGALTEVVAKAPADLDPERQIEPEIGDRPDDAEGGDQIDGQGLPPGAEVKADPVPKKKTAPKKATPAKKAQ